MKWVRRAVGRATAEWEESEPLRWWLNELLGEGKLATECRQRFDFTALRLAFDEALLVALRDALIDARLKVGLRTCQTNANSLKGVLLLYQRHVTKDRGETAKVERIDRPFLTVLWSLRKQLTRHQAIPLKAFYNEHRANAALFAPDIHPSDIPQNEDAASRVENLRKNILATALTQTALVHILNVTETAFEKGELDLSRYSFSRLLVSRAARPETLRNLRCKDLQVDKHDGVASYFLTVSLPKARTAVRPRATVKLHADVGRVLEMQREAVVRRLGHLVDKRNAEHIDSPGPYTLGDLALFPSPQPGTRSELNLGVCTRFPTVYLGPLRALAKRNLTCNMFRHTMGTQLAIAGCSSSTIAAVLLHATTETARVYVDLIFDGVIDELSSSLEPAFLEHFPVAFEGFVSRSDLIAPEKRVSSRSGDGTRRQTTGECGRLQICQYAPLACYECERFRPAYDADHTINLDRVSDEITWIQDTGIQRREDLRRWQHIANRIRVVIQICELKQASLAATVRAQLGSSTND